MRSKKGGVAERARHGARGWANGRTGSGMQQVCVQDHRTKLRLRPTPFFVKVIGCLMEGFGVCSECFLGLKMMVGKESRGEEKKV